MRKKIWRLTSGLVALIPSTGTGEENLVYLGAIEKKSYKKSLSSSINSPCEEVNINDNEFFLKISEHLEVFVKCKEFPKPDEYYRVENFYRAYNNTPYINDFITQVNNNKGDFGETVFEAAFSDDNKDVVYFLTPDMKDYDPAFKEMRRRLNCEIFKKTKKWIPGHRYDTMNNTYYYLGEFLCRKDGKSSTSFLDDNSMSTVHLVVSNVKDGVSKVSDILKSEVINYSDNGEYDNYITDIQVISTLPTSVDSGETLENDVDDIRSYWKYLLENSINSVNNYKSELYKDLDLTAKNFYDNRYESRTVFDIFSIQTPNKLDYTLSKDTRDALTSFLKKDMMECMLTYWDDSGKSSSSLSKNNSIDKNSSALLELYIKYTIKDSNINRKNYYSELFNKLGIDSLGISKDLVNQTLNDPESNLVLSGNIYDYIDFGSIYFRNHSMDGKINRISKQRVNSTNYKLDVVNLESIFAGFDNLLDLIKNIVTNARNNFGIGVSNMYDTNIGTKKNPKVYTSIEITISDIINFYGNDISNIPGDIANDIIKSRFWNLIITIDKDKELS